MDVNVLLGPGGSLTRSLPDYEDRPAQRRMATAVLAAFTGEVPLLVEAGTGTGKSLAYLLPALASGKQVVVSTGTRALQDQLLDSDVPMLRSIWPEPFEVVALKGISNYVCQRRAEDVLRQPDLLGSTTDPLVEWLHSSSTGDFAEIDGFAIDPALRARLSTTTEGRLGSRCPKIEQCFVAKARKRAEGARLIVVNHHLLFSDFALRDNDAKILPDYAAVIFDEAHLLEDAITDRFAVSVSANQLAALCRDLRHSAAMLGGDDAMWARTATHIEVAGKQLFGSVSEALLGSPGRVALADDLLSAQLREAWLALDTALDEAAYYLDQLRDGDGSGAAVAEHLHGRGQRLRDDLAELAEGNTQSSTSWVEAQGGTTIKRVPTDAGPILQRFFHQRTSAAVLTSATLTTENSFDYVRHRLGLSSQQADELMLASPFDYSQQALLYLPADLPDARDEAFLASSAQRMVELVELVGGATLILCTSFKALRFYQRWLSATLAVTVHCQGEEEARALVRRFRDDHHSVLLGTRTFWQGVDVPGKTLSQVIVDRLPFAPPEDPLISGRSKAVAQQGLHPFVDYQLPEAALALKQGMGRLIRRGDDRGILAILDNRILTKGYGKTFLRSLPHDLRRTSSLEQVRRWWGDD